LREHEGNDAPKITVRRTVALGMPKIQNLFVAAVIKFCVR